MKRLLYIESSPRKERSTSIRVAKAFLEAYREANPGDAVEKLDLWRTAIPEFDGAAIDAKYRLLHGEEHTPPEKAAWDAVGALVDRFRNADKILIGVPMWNFGVPYRLKHYIDVITQPGLTFSFTPEEGFKGLVTGKPAVVVYTRGGAYSDSQSRGLDYQRPYLETWLGFIGFTDIRAIVVEPTLGGPDESAKVRAAALEQASAAARTF